MSVYREWYSVRVSGTCDSVYSAADCVAETSVPPAFLPLRNSGLSFSSLSSSVNFWNRNEVREKKKVA